MCTFERHFAHKIHHERDFEPSFLLRKEVARTYCHIWLVNRARPIVNRLAEKGHNITVLSPDIDHDPPLNVHYIQLENTYSILNRNKSYGNDILKRSEENPFEATMSYYKFGYLSCVGATSSQGFYNLQHYPGTFVFDLIIYDFTCGPCLLPFLHRFNYPPLISVSAFNNPQFTPDLVGGQKFSSYIPHFTLKYDTKMDFWQRTVNMLVYNFDSFYRNWIFLPKLEQLAYENFNFTFANLQAMEKRTLLVLVNSHPALDFPELSTPNTISVGGLQIVQPKRLPDDIKKFINASNKGAILFAMGTNFKSNMFDTKKAQMFLKVFEKFTDYHFLWKFEPSALMIPLPENVMVRNWLPQNDILAHQKIRAFITHSGLLSTHEATWHAVPMIGIPVYCDQHRNLHKSEIAGVAIRLDLQNLSRRFLKEALNEILNNSSYRRNMKQRSRNFKDQPEHPLDRAIWWIEWAMRNPKSSYLRSPAIDLGFLATNNYDILLTFIVLLALIWQIVKYLIKSTKLILLAYTDSVRDNKKTN